MSFPKNLKKKGEVLPLLISFVIMTRFINSLWDLIILFPTMFLLFLSEFFSSFLVSNNIRKSRDRVREFIFIALQNIYRKIGLLTPKNDANLRILLHQPLDYSVELGFSPRPNFKAIENKELLEAEKALFQLDDKYALHLLIIFGFPLVYFLFVLFFYLGNLHQVTLIFAFYSVGTIFYSFLSDEAYSFEGISSSLNDINGTTPVGLKDLVDHEKYLDLKMLEISQIPTSHQLQQGQTPVATLIQSTISLDPFVKKKIFEAFLKSFESFKEKETVFIAKQQVQRSKSVFAMVAVAFILGIFVAISHSIFTVFATLPIELLFSFPFSFPRFLPEFTGLLFSALNKGTYKPIIAFIIYYFVFLTIALLFSNLIVLA